MGKRTRDGLLLPLEVVRLVALMHKLPNGVLVAGRGENPRFRF
jgi:hypothetical protein